MYISCFWLHGLFSVCNSCLVLSNLTWDTLYYGLFGCPIQNNRFASLFLLEKFFWRVLEQFFYRVVWELLFANVVIFLKVCMYVILFHISLFVSICFSVTKNRICDKHYFNSEIFTLHTYLQTKLSVRIGLDTLH